MSKRTYVLRGHVPVAGAEAPPLLVNVPYRDGVDLPTLASPVLVTTFKHGAKIHWKPRAPRPKTGSEGTRGCIGDMSPKAKRRAGFCFSNAPHGWEAMLTLTFEEQHPDPKSCLDKLTRAMRETFDMRCQWGYIMEYQERGVAHYHFFLGSDWFALNEPAGSRRVEVVTRRGRKTSIVRGVLDRWFVDQWVSACQNLSEAFRRFQNGGILELFDSPDAAGRYVGKEGAKARQKALPEGVNGGRRWWYLSPEGMPVKEGVEHLVSYPLAKCLGQVYDKSLLRDHFAWKPVGDQLDIPF